MEDLVEGHNITQSIEDHDTSIADAQQSNEDFSVLASSNVNYKPLEPSDPASFTYFMRKLWANPKLQMVHTRKVDYSTGKPIVRPRPVDPWANPFVHVSSPVYHHAGQVHRVTVQDRVTAESARLDVMFCNPSACADCNTGESPIDRSIFDETETRLPQVHRDDTVRDLCSHTMFQPNNEAHIKDVTDSARDDYSWHELRYSC